LYIASAVVEHNKVFALELEATRRGGPCAGAPEREPLWPKIADVIISARLLHEQRRDKVHCGARGQSGSAAMRGSKAAGVWYSD
jgi:hypothetical protein